MVLLIFYILAIVFGYVLMFLFIKFFEKRRIYYIAWGVAIVLLLNLSAIMGESYAYIFQADNYSEIGGGLYFLFM